MPLMSAGVPVAPEGAVALSRGPLSVDIVLRPLSVTLRRDGRRVLRSAGLWAAEGSAADHFVQLTEGVIVNETLAPCELAASATVMAQSEDAVTLRVRLRGGRQGSLHLRLADGDRLVLEVAFEGGPLRIAVDWDARADERFVGLGARHAAHLDQAGRTVQLGADRRYTGPDCPAELLAQGGIPQADCAPVPWVISSRGYAVWADTHGNGTRFEFGDERVAVSARADAGPLRVHVVAARTPAACLRAYCRLTGFPPVLPEWGYGFWKSRDVYEHQSDVEEDFEGFARHGIALDAIVLDSPWATQYNTWEFNPHQFPDAAGLIARMRSGGVHTVVWVTPWVNLDSRDGQVPPDPGSQRLHREPAANYAPAAAVGHFVRRPDGAPFVARWWMGTGSPVDFTSPTAEHWWRESAKRVLALGVEGIKADDGEGYYFPDEVRFADGRTGAQAAWAYGALYRASM
jgi:alpha-glucosidase (family GH31 glycosyl hydrolase)